jgi:hypothetical protein
MRLRDLFITQLLGGSGGGSSGPAVLEEITITENGVYEPIVSVELGGTYTFKEELTEADIINLHESGDINPYGTSLIAEWGEDNEYGLGTGKEAAGYCLWYADIDNGYDYVPESLIEEWGVSSSGWWVFPDEGDAYKVTAPTITLPENIDSFYGDINLLAPIFDISPIDGFNRVVVNVDEGGNTPAVLDEITITENGVYEAYTEVKSGGTYKFKDSYTNEELKEFYDNKLYCEVSGAEIRAVELWTSDSSKPDYAIDYHNYQLNKSYCYLSEILIVSEDFKPNTEPGWYL